MTIDDLLCNADAGTLRSVIAASNLPDAEVIRLFEETARRTARESDAQMVADDATFARQVGMSF